MHLLKKMIFAFSTVLALCALEPRPVYGKDIRLTLANGELLGETLEESSEIAVFKGIPYATPPVGNRRWAPPGPVTSWVGTLQAKTSAPACLQQITQADIAARGEVFSFPQSEDCLYLNVFAPADVIGANDARDLPVLFKIHGGGRTKGSASNSTESINALVRSGVVVVAPQYRLGIFSFFAHPELSAESPHHASGNYGMLDLVAALEWVQLNISAFGGDPDAVTISGASGGGTATGILLATPLAKGLFHRAAAFCSNAGIARMHRLDQGYLDQPSAEALGVRFAENLGANSLAELRHIPAQQLQHYLLGLNLAPFDPPSGAGEVVDGWMFPKPILELHRSGARNDVPVMLGFNADEVSIFAYAGLIMDVPADAAAYESRIEALYGPLAEEFLRFYPSNQRVDSIYDAARDRVAGYGVETVARYSHQVSSNTYLYYMAHRAPSANVPIAGGDREQGVRHCTDFRYFSGSMPQADRSDVDWQLSATMWNYWVSFIKTGDPNIAGQPQWNPYTQAPRDYMRFEDGRAQPSRHLLPGMWKLYEKIRLHDEETGQFRSWQGGWASDSLLSGNGRPEGSLDDAGSGY